MTEQLNFVVSKNIHMNWEVGVSPLYESLLIHAFGNDTGVAYQGCEARE